MNQFDLVFVILIGTLLGSLAGILPGLHPNTISQIISKLNFEDNLALAGIIIIAAAVNNLVALIPAIFLFIPDSDSVLSILPAQKMVLKGEGRLAVLVCAFSAVLTLFFLIFILPVSYMLLPSLFTLVKPYLAYILILLSILFIIQDKDKIKESFFVFLLSGLFGIAILTTPISALFQESLFAVFIGFFALSSMILSLNEKSLIPKQKEVNYEIEFGKHFLIIVFLSTLLGAVADIFPAINSPAQLATFVSPLANTPLLFLSSTTSITVSHYANSIVAFERIGKARTGTLVNIGDIIHEINFVSLVWLVAFYFIGTMIGILILVSLSDLIVKRLNGLDKNLMNAALFIFLLASLVMFSGIFGVFISILATFIGIIPPLLGVRRTNLMAFLIVPSILLLL